MAPELLLVLPFILVAAALYASVGHGGATAYLAILSLAGFALDLVVTTVLVLNILAAGIAFLFFQQAGHLRARLLWPFLVTSVPAAYLGGAIDLSGRLQELILGVGLALAALRLLLVRRPVDQRISASGRAFWVLAPLLGAVLGFLAGATGIGGGIFLSPVLVLLGWASVKEAGTVAAAFIVFNSAAGLVARLPRTPVPVDLMLPLIGVVLVGALLGAFLGARRIPPRGTQIALGLVLAVASIKALLSL